MLRAFDGFSGTFTVLCALKLAPMFFVRPGELRQAEWSQFNLEKGEWRYLVDSVKQDGRFTDNHLGRSACSVCTSSLVRVNSTR